MERVTQADEPGIQPRRIGIPERAMAWLATISVFLLVLEHWKEFHRVQRFSTVLVLFNLLLSPSLRPRWAIFKYLDKNESAADSVYFAYLSLMLVCLLFS